MFFIIGALFVTQGIMRAEEKTSLSEQGLSNVSLNAKDIRERGIHDISDLTLVVPGLFIPSYGSAQTTAIYLRGVGSRAHTPVVGMYVDDMPWLQNSSFKTKIGEIENIEVLRGPQSTMFGQNTMGGLIRIVTKNPIDYQGTFIERSMANHYCHYTAVSHYQRFTDKLGLSAGIAYRSMGSFFCNSYSGQKADADRSLRAHARLLYRPTNVDNIDFLANYELCTQDVFPYYLESVSDDDPLKNQLSQDIGKISSNDDNLYLRHLLNVGVKVKHKWSKVTLNNVLAFQLLNDDLRMDQDFTHLNLGTFQHQQHGRTLSEDIALKSQPSAWRHWEWVTGANLNSQWLHTWINDTEQYETPTKSVALYHQSTLCDLFNAKGVTLIIGLRLSYEHVGFSCTNLQDGQSRDGWWQLMPRTSLQYSFSKGNVYVTASRGYRSGGYNYLADIDIPQLCRPEYAWNYEVGTHFNLLNNRIFLDASVFLTNITNQQINQVSPSGLGYITKNAGMSRSCGGELSLRSKITNRLQAHASYGYTHATFSKYNFSADVSYKGNYVPFTPQHTVDIGVNYGLFLPKIFNRQLLDRMSVSTNWHGLGKIYWTEDNLASEPFYDALDAKLSFYRKHLEFSVWANNIYNSRCRTFYFLSMNRGYSQKNKPFQCGFEIKFYFN